MWVADVNGDGKLDLLVGDLVVIISPAKGVSVEQFTKKFLDWKKNHDSTFKKLHSETAGEAEREKAREEFIKIYKQRTEFMNTDETGFVWLYLQK